jgi:Papain-like cysteine protease AvrRpt2
MAMYKVSPAVKPVNQNQSTNCWLACLEMMFQWKCDRGDASKDKSKICSLIDAKTPYWAKDLENKGIAPYECADVARALGLQPTGAGNYTPEILHDIISKRGPVWVAGMWLEGMSHVVVVTACDPADGRTRIINPWKNHDLSDAPSTVSWLNARGNLWKSYEGSVMYWK